MSVTNTTKVAIIPFLRDVGQRPGYPSARWLLSSAVTGDGGGGVATCAGYFETSPNSTARLWRLKGLTCWSTGVSASPAGYLRLGEIDQTIGGVSVYAQCAFWENIGIASTGWAGLADGATGVIPLLGWTWITSPASRQTYLMKSVDQNTNAAVYALSAWGWVWDAEAYEFGPIEPW